MTATALLCFVLSAPPAPPAPPVEPAAIDGRPVAAWVADLGSSDADTCRAATAALVKAGPKARSAVPALIKMLDPKVPGSYQAIGVLGAIGPDAKAAVPALLALVPKDGTSSGYGAEQVAVTLALIDGPKVEATRALLMAPSRCTPSILPGSQTLQDHPGLIVSHVTALCGDKDANVREKAAWFLSTLKERQSATVPAKTLYESAGAAAKGVAPALEKLLADEVRTVRVAAARAITHVAPELVSKALPVVVAIGVESAGKTKGGFYVSDVFNPVPVESAKLLVPLFEHANTHVREWAIGHASALPAREPIEEALRNGTTGIRTGAAKALGNRYSSGAGSAPALVEALKDSEFAVRFTAAEALVNVGARESDSHRAAVPVLIEGLQQKEEHVRFQASQILLRTGPTAQGAVPTLKKLLNDQTADVRLEAALALVAIDPRGAAGTVPALTEGLKSADTSATRAAKALAVLGPVAKAAVPDLVEQFGAEHPHLRMYAADAAARIDPAQAPKSVAVLVGLLKDDKNQMNVIRRYSLGTLRAIGSAAKPALPTLAELLKDDGAFHTEVALAMIAIDADGAKPAFEWARSVLGKSDREDGYDLLERLYELGPKAEPLMPELLKVLDSKAIFERRSAVRAVAAIGPNAKDALPKLKLMAENDPRTDIRKLAAEAVKKIESK